MRSYRFLGLNNGEEDHGYMVVVEISSWQDEKSWLVQLWSVILQQKPERSHTRYVWYDYLVLDPMNDLDSSTHS